MASDSQGFEDGPLGRVAHVHLEEVTHVPCNRVDAAVVERIHAPTDRGAGSHRNQKRPAEARRKPLDPSTWPDRQRHPTRTGMSKYTAG